ncbi:MAG: Hsp20 family protein [Alphaproteobacteria bacterium]|nr:Hsp20 family protein [Alphaproteobacteria bacterium SS10]
MRTYDLSPLFRSTVGFDRLNRMLESAAGLDEAPSYPPYNIERLGENDYRITMAVAGFGRDDIDITVKEHSLTVTGKGKNTGNSDGVTYLHRGIANRSFERRFDLAEHIEVVDADLTDGMLNITLQRVVPEALKPRTIEIKTDTPQKVLDNDGGKKAA